MARSFGNATSTRAHFSYNGRGHKRKSLAAAAAILTSASGVGAIAQVGIDQNRTGTVMLDSEPPANSSTATIGANVTVDGAGGEALVGQNQRWSVNNAASR